MKHLMIKKLFVGLLSAALFLTACAMTVPLEESHKTEMDRVSDRSNGLSTEELSAFQSDPQGSKAEPAIILPEEKETVLELVTTFKTGEDGLFQYFFYWESSGPEYAAYWTTRAECADEKGNIYAVLVTSGSERYICRLNDGKLYYCGDIKSPIDVRYSNGLLYLRLENHYVVTIDVESGERTTITPFAYLQEHTGFRLVSFGGEEPFWLRYDDNECYSLDGKELSAERYPCTVLEAEQATGKATLINRGAERTITLDGDIAGGDWSLQYEDSEKLLCVADRFKKGFLDKPYTAVLEEVYCLYDQNGNITSKFKSTVFLHDKQPCSLPFTQHETDYTLEAYDPRTITIDSYTFKEVFDHHMVCGSDGTLYLLLYYLDHGEVYRILPGYENVTFSELTKADASKFDMSLDKSPDSVSAVSSHKHTEYPIETVFSRAERMNNTKWNLSEDNIVRLPNTKLPTYIAKIVTANGGKANNASMVGIPYCWGGFNEIDSNSRKFIDVIVKKGIMAGNTTAKDDKGNRQEHVPNTAGIDCSGYVSAAFGLTDKESTGSILDYCKSVSTPQKGDLLDNAGSHVILFYGVDTEGDYIIYESSVDDDEKCKIRVLTKQKFDEYINLKEYSLYRPAYISSTYTKDSTTHWQTCTFSGCNKTFHITKHRTTSSNPYYCTVCGYIPAVVTSFPVSVSDSDIGASAPSAA